MKKMAEIKKKLLGKDARLHIKGKRIGISLDPTEGVTIKKDISGLFSKGVEGLSKGDISAKVRQHYDLGKNTSISITGDWQEGGKGRIFANFKMNYNKGGYVKKYARGGGIRKVRR